MNPAHVFEAARRRLVIAVAAGIALMAAGAGAAPAIAASGSGLSGVSCSATKACTGVGDSVNASGTSVTLAERWNGATWTIQPTPTPGGEGSLGGVSCARRAPACMAVGSSASGSSGAQAALALDWTGGTWTSEPVPVPAGAESSALSGVSCTSSSACMAVGDYVDSSGRETPFSKEWNGTGMERRRRSRARSQARCPECPARRRRRARRSKGTPGGSSAGTAAPGRCRRSRHPRRGPGRSGGFSSWRSAACRARTRATAPRWGTCMACTATRAPSPSASATNTAVASRSIERSWRAGTAAAGRSKARRRRGTCSTDPAHQRPVAPSAITATGPWRCSRSTAGAGRSRAPRTPLVRRAVPSQACPAPRPRPAPRSANTSTARGSKPPWQKRGTAPRGRSRTLPTPEAPGDALAGMSLRRMPQTEPFDPVCAAAGPGGASGSTTHEESGSIGDGLLASPNASRAVTRRGPTTCSLCNDPRQYGAKAA